MKNIPNFAILLPSKVKTEVIKFYYDQLVSAKLNSYLNPMYDTTLAFRDSREFKDDYAEAMW